MICPGTLMWSDISISTTFIPLFNLIVRSRDRLREGGGGCVYSNRRALVVALVLHSEASVGLVVLRVSQRLFRFGLLVVGE